MERHFVLVFNSTTQHVPTAMNGKARLNSHLVRIDEVFLADRAIVIPSRQLQNIPHISTGSHDAI